MEPTQPTVKLTAIEEEKVNSIVEICNVSRDEAIRVLEACHMDETMAIERFLSGKEISTWSQVSKKKKPAPHMRSAANSRSYPSYNSRAHDRDRDRDRRDRDRHPSDSNNTHRGSSRRHQSTYSQKNKDSSAARRSSPPDPLSAENSYQSQLPTETWPSPPPPAVETWADQPAVTAETWADPVAQQTEQWGEPTLPIPQPDSTSSAPANETWNDAPQSAAGSSPAAWGRPDPATETSPPQSADTQPLDSDSTAINSSHVSETLPQQPVIPTSTVKRTFNYAAAAAAGTSHAKPAPIATEIPVSAPAVSTALSPIAEVDSAANPTAVDDVTSTEAADPKKRRNRGGRKARARPDAERPVRENIAENALPAAPAVLNTEPFESHASSTTPSPGDVRIDSSAPPTPTAWGARTTPAADPQEDKHLEDTATAVAVASSAVVGSESAPGDSLSLQFGSFGLSGLDGVNWSATDQKPKEPVPNPIVPPEPSPVASSAVLPTVSTDASAVPVVQASVGIPAPSVPLPSALEVSGPISSVQDTRVQAQVAASVPTAVSSATSSASGMFPILPVGPGGNYPPPNYGTPYLMPPFNGYSPALGSYENGGDLGSSRAPNLGPPAPLALYDPASLSGIASGNGKYGGIPGLGDMPSLQGVQTGVSKDGLHMGAGDMEKNNSTSTSGLPTGMDPLATPYMMPGYPSMQYPMYTFPTAPYAPPPGMAPGPNPFPYAPTAQVSSQGARGGFGFDDGSAALGGNSRNGSGLGESMYTPGGYLNTAMTHGGSQKAAGDGSYKAVRGNPGTSLGGMGMTGGIVHGMTYSDYSAGIAGGSNAVGGNAGGPGGWNNRQTNGNRADVNNGPGVVSNQSMAGASPNSSVYAAGPGGAPSGYWPPQQAGYYP